jgi:hypothetical protein
MYFFRQKNMQYPDLEVPLLVPIREDWARRSAPALGGSPYPAETKKLLEEVRLHMRFISEERPRGAVDRHLQSMGRWWVEELKREWSKLSREEKVREAGRRWQVTWFLRDQFAWRVCVLCRSLIDEVGELHLGRPCGHQVHSACWRQWTAATGNMGRGTLCPQGCGWPMTLCKVEEEGLLMPAISGPGGTGGEGGVGDVLYPVGAGPPPLENWMPRLWRDGRPLNYPYPMLVAPESYVPFLE